MDRAAERLHVNYKALSPDQGAGGTVRCTLVRAQFKRHGSWSNKHGNAGCGRETAAGRPFRDSDLAYPQAATWDKCAA